jgi:regulatory protein YycI of two-component signal transduction system YycFG
MKGERPMDWSKTKTIFIAVFLVLDLFLAVMFFNKYGATRFEVIKETSIEEKLQSDRIEYEKMPADAGQLSIITAKPKTFSEKEFFFLTKQTIAIPKSGTELVSELDKPYDTDEAAREKIVSFVKNNVLQGDRYSYWKRDRDKKTVIFYQQFDDKKLFENISGLLTVQLDDEDNIISYKQTMLSDIDKNRDEEAILPAFQAIDALYKNGLIQPDSKIANAELGYYTFVQLTESQVLSPTWYFQLKKDDKVEEIYVNAYDGSIYQTEKES